MKQLFYRLVRTLSLRVAVAVVTFVLALYFFAWMLHQAFLRQEDRWDGAVFRYFDTRVPEGLYEATRVFTFFGKPDFLIPLYIVLLAYFVVTRQREYALEFGVLASRPLSRSP